jgi:hypothetical protein
MEIVQFAVGKQEFIVRCQCRSHDLVHFYPRLLRFLLNLLSLFLVTFTVRLPFFVFITVFFIFPLFIISVFLSLRLLIVNQHLNLLVFNSGDWSFLFF